MQENGNKKLVHILSYLPERRCKAMALEDEITIMDAKFALRLDGKKVRKVYLAPSGIELEYAVEADYCSIKVPRIDGYALVVVEFEE